MKKEPRKTPAFVYLSGAAHYLVNAVFQEDSIREFTVRTENGHIIKLRDVRAWIIAASEHFEQKARASGEPLYLRERPTYQHTERRADGRFAPRRPTS